MNLGVILLIILGSLGVTSVIYGIVAYCETGDIFSVFAVIFGGLGIALTILFIINIVKMDDERTEKIIGRGVITTSNDIDYTDGGKVSSDKITFYFLMKNGDKVIVDKTEWESDKTEFTYKIDDAEKIKE